ncbi:MAG: hypothetical protein GY731_07375, partial [Gammaproteobacteria bacterium]|nr:hypothetical protein [Gammaproteobacteria bacterium]
PYLIRPRIRLEKRDGKSSLRITTSAPIGEPVVGLSVRLDCDQPKGTIVRDYKVLLDPVGYGSPIPTGATPQPAMPVKDLSKPAGLVWKAPPEAKQRRSPAVADLSRFNGYRTVEVLPGDTLYRIISDIYGGDSVERSLIFDAIIAANPRIFPGGDPDRLREGVKLRVPDTGAWDRHSLEGEPVSSPEPRVDSEQEAVSPKSGLRILSAAEESWQVSLKLAWEFDEARLVSNERRLPQELDTGETVEVVAVAPAEGPEIDAVEGEGKNGTEVEEAGVNTGTARLELVVAEARIEELNQEITQLRRILEVQERPPVPVSPSQPVSMPAILAGFPWYGWLIGGLAILLLATGLYQLVGRRAVVDGSIPVAPGPIESESIPQFLPGEISEIPPAEPTNRHEGQGGKPLEQNEASTNQDPVAKRVAEIAGIPPSPSPAQDPLREQVRVQEPEIGGVMPDSWRDQRQTVHGL